MIIKDALIELRHIQLELKNGRCKHLRHFVDQYYCYSNPQYLNRNKNPKWESILWNEWVSTKAEDLKNKKVENIRQLVVKDHIVPLNIITKKLFELGTNCRIDEIKSIIDELLHFATITKDENTYLNNLGLRKSMPSGYEEVGHNLFNDKFARYSKAKIDIRKIS